ncbi:MAG: hypothetical protein KJO73_09095 [Croceitalea sp.]|nr:hypothetical protein [Croceitalea sp.]
MTKTDQYPLRNLKRFAKNTIDSNLKEIKNIVDANPSLILEVCKKEKKVLISNKDATFRVFEFSNAKFKKVLAMIVDEIRTRPNPNERVERWECEDIDGIWSYEIERQILRRREKIPAKDKPIYSKRALSHLAKEFNVPAYMADLFLNELKLDNSPANERARNTARLLGLME